MRASFHRTSHLMLTVSLCSKCVLAQAEPNSTGWILGMVVLTLSCLLFVFGPVIFLLYRFYHDPESNCYRFKCFNDTSVDPLDESSSDNESQVGATQFVAPQGRDSGRGFHSPPPMQRPTSSQSSEPKQHIMISYEASSKADVIDFRKILLENGYRVWFDRELDSDVESKGGKLATLIEQAAVVVPVLTTPYQENEICRKEVEYADKIKKPLVPVRMEKKFKPGGWLGFLLGNTLFHDLSNPNTYNMQIENFLEAIEHLGESALMDEEEQSYMT